MTARKTLERLGFDTSECDPRIGDPWGFAMGALFDLAHAIEHYGRDYPPQAWGFGDGMGCDGLLPSRDAARTGEDRQARYVAAYIARHPEREREVVRAGNVLDRYIGILDRAGRSY